MRTPSSLAVSFLLAGLLPAAAYELVIVLTCLTFSLSAVLLTSTQTIERQQDVIATLQKVKMDVYVRR